jgi:MFS family permease
MNTSKLLRAAVLAAAIGAPIAGFISDVKGQPMTSSGVRVPFLHSFPIGPLTGQDELASLERANEWLNSPSLSVSGLRGKVVLVNFWTYTCIN